MCTRRKQNRSEFHRNTIYGYLSVSIAATAINTSHTHTHIIMLCVLHHFMNVCRVMLRYCRHPSAILRREQCVRLRNNNRHHCLKIAFSCVVNRFRFVDASRKCRAHPKSSLENNDAGTKNRYIQSPKFYLIFSFVALARSFSSIPCTILRRMQLSFRPEKCVTLACCLRYRYALLRWPKHARARACRNIVRRKTYMPRQRTHLIAHSAS